MQTYRGDLRKVCLPGERETKTTQKQKSQSQIHLRGTGREPRMAENKTQQTVSYAHIVRRKARVSSHFISGDVFTASYLYSGAA